MHVNKNISLFLKKFLINKYIKMIIIDNYLNFSLSILFFLMKEKTEKRLNSENQRQNLCEFSYVFFVWFLSRNTFFVTIKNFVKI